MLERILWRLFPGTMWRVESKAWHRGWWKCWDEHVLPHLAEDAQTSATDASEAEK